MIFVGDVHGLWGDFLDIVNQFPDEEIIQLGDFGLGFPQRERFPDPDDFGDNVKFIRGNHDNPEVCARHPNYLGDYGVYKNIGYISGAWSIDQPYRIEGKTWWAGEQLLYSDLDKAIEQICDEKPSIIISHDTAPVFAKELCLKLYPTITGQALDALWQSYKPKMWVCGHYHNSIEMVIEGTQFICLNELEHRRIY